MICYRDRSFCGSHACKNKCGCKLTSEMAEDAKKWWLSFTKGKSDEAPIAYMNFCDENGEIIMGCDIHAHIEINIDDNWHYFKEIRIMRSYDLFGRMVNDHNRRSGNGIANARNLPLDVNPVTKLLLEDSDYHTHSWLSSKEIMSIEALKELEIDDRIWRPLTLEQLINELKHDIRLVFAFDN